MPLIKIDTRSDSPSGCLATPCCAWFFEYLINSLDFSGSLINSIEFLINLL